jgi:Fe-S cluster biosynthesis and repair protein YggX
MDPGAQAYLKEQLEKFFFDRDNIDQIQGYKPK